MCQLPGKVVGIVTNESYGEGREGDFYFIYLYCLSDLRLDFVVSNVELLVNSELGSVWKEVVTILRYAPGPFLEGLRETAITFVQLSLPRFETDIHECKSYTLSVGWIVSK